MEVRKFTVDNKIPWIHLLVVPVVPLYCTIIELSEFVPIMPYFATPSLLSTKELAILVGENTVNTGVLQLAVLKRLTILKGPIFNIFLKLVY